MLHGNNNKLKDYFQFSILENFIKDYTEISL